MAPIPTRFIGSMCYDTFMSSYYCLEDPKSDLDYTPIPEKEFFQAILSIAKRHGLKITDEMILKEIHGVVQKDGLKSKAPYDKH